MLKQVYESQVMPYAIPVMEGLYPDWISAAFSGVHYMPAGYWAQDITQGPSWLMGLEAVPKSAGSDESYIVQFGVLQTDYYPSFGVIGWVVDGKTGVFLGHIQNGVMTSSAGAIQGEWIKQSRAGKFWYNFASPVFGGLFECTIDGLDELASARIVFTGPEIDKSSHFAGGFDMAGERFMCVDEVENIALILTYATPSNHISVHNFTTGALIRHVPCAGDPIDCFWEDPKHAYVLGDNGMMTLIDYTTGQVLSVLKYDFPPAKMGIGRGYRNGFNGNYDRVMKKFIFCQRTPNVENHGNPYDADERDYTVVGGDCTLRVKGYVDISPPERLMKPIPLIRSVVGKTTHVVTRLVDGTNRPMQGLVTGEMGDADGVLRNQIGSNDQYGYVHFAIDCKVADTTNITVQCTIPDFFAPEVPPLYTLPDGSTTDDPDIYAAALTGTYINDIGPHSTKPLSTYHPIVVIPDDAVNVEETETTVHYDGVVQGSRFVPPMRLSVDVEFIQRAVTAQRYDVELVSGVPNSHWIDVCWAESLGLFVAIARLDAGGIDYGSVTIFDQNNGVGWDGMVMTSPDGENWTEIYRVHPTEGLVPVRYWYRIIFVEAWGLFIVSSDVYGYPPDYGGVFPFPPTYGMTSPDGETWTANDNAPPVTFTAFVYVPEWGKLVAVGNASLTGPSPAHVVGITDDGINWERFAAPRLQNWSGIAWSPTLAKLVAVSENGLQRCMTSTDGESWTLHTVPLGAWRDVAWAPDLGLFVAVSGNVVARVGDYAHAAVMTSPDGETWTVVEDLPSPRIWDRVLWIPERDRLIAVGGAPDGYKTVVKYTNTNGYETQIPCLLMDSTDGVAWNEHIGVKKEPLAFGVFHSLSDPDSGNDAWDFHARFTTPLNPATTLVIASDTAVFVTDGEQYGVYTITDETFTSGVLPDAAATAINTYAYRNDAGLGVYGTKLFIVNSVLSLSSDSSRIVSVINFTNPSSLIAETKATSSVAGRAAPAVADPVVRGLFIEQHVYFPQIGARYNVTSDVWQATAYPDEGIASTFYRPVLVKMDGKMYAIGGTLEYTNEVNTVYTNRALEYDPFADTWQLVNLSPASATGFGDDNGAYTCVVAAMSALFLFLRTDNVMEYIAKGTSSIGGSKNLLLASRMAGSMRGIGYGANSNRIWFAPDHNGTAGDDWLTRVNDGLISEYTEAETEDRLLYSYNPFKDGFFSNFVGEVWNGSILQYGYGPYYDKPLLWDGTRFLTTHNTFYRNVVDDAARSEDLPPPNHMMVATVDGETYTELAGTTDGNLAINALVKTSSRYVMANGGRVYTSTDLTGWTRSAIPGYVSYAGEVPLPYDTEDAIKKLVVDGSRVIALRAHGEIMSSNDHGVTWSHHRNVGITLDTSGGLHGGWLDYGHSSLTYTGSQYITTEWYAGSNGESVSILHFSNGDSLTDPFTAVEGTIDGLPLEDVILTHADYLDGYIYLYGSKRIYHPATDPVSFVVFGPCLYRSADGSSWLDISPEFSLTNLTDLRSTDIRSLHKLNDGKLIAVCDAVDFVSADNGATWSEFSRLEWPSVGEHMGYFAPWGGVDNGEFILMMIEDWTNNSLSNVSVTNFNPVTFDGTDYNVDPMTHYAGPDSRERAPAAAQPDVMPDTSTVPNPRSARCAWSPSLEKLVIITSTGEPNFTQDQVYRPNTYTMATTTLSGEEVTRYFFRTRYDILVVPEV